MQPAIVPNIPLFVICALNPSVLDGKVWATGNLTSVEWRVSGGTPTQSFEFGAASEAAPTGAKSALSLIALAESVWSDARSLSDWERKDADEFFWSQFA